MTVDYAAEVAEVEPDNAVRIAWWGAEEEGLLGSEHYVAELSDAGLADIALYLAFDMIASPNYTTGIYDGDNSGGTAEPGFIPGRLGRDRGRLRGVLRLGRPALRRPGVLGPLGLRTVHRRGHPDRRPVHRR